MSYNFPADHMCPTLRRAFQAQIRLLNHIFEDFKIIIEK